MTRWIIAIAVLAAQLKIDVQLVNVVTTVADEKGRLVSGLTPDDFIVEEDGQRQSIAHLSQSIDTPISMGILLDTSGSMVNKMRAAQVAVQRFIQALHPDDDIFLMTFASHTALISDFTSDRNRLFAALRAGVSVGGATVLYDGMFQALEKVKTGRLQKKAVLLVTDGEDNGSTSRFDRTLEDIRESEMLVYCIGIRAADGFDMMPEGNAGMDPITGETRKTIVDPRLNTVDMKVLNAFADASGGRAWEVAGTSNPKAIDTILQQVAEELRSQYSIGYYPATHEVRDAKWHRIRIRMKNPAYHARARTEYLGK